MMNIKRKLLIIIFFPILFGTTYPAFNQISTQKNNLNENLQIPDDNSALSFTKSAAWVDEDWKARLDTIMFNVGDYVPDFTLYSTTGIPFTLFDELDKGKPVLLITGSHSCAVARRKLNAINDLTLKYKMDLTIVMIYVIEAHPVDTMSPYSIENKIYVGKTNIRDDILVENPKTYKNRIDLCDFWQNKHDLKPIILVDNPDNEFWLKYGQAPNLAYLIKPDKTVFMRQSYLEPVSMEENIKILLNGK